GQTYHHGIPFVAHKRLTVVSPPVHTVRVRPSIIMAEIDRINHKVRPSLAYQPAEDFLNSRSAVSFDDETRSIRAQTAALLKRIHEPLPRATKIFPISVTTYQETPIPERITSDAYIRRLLGPTRNVKQEVLTYSHYDEPAKRLMGKGHLACVSFAGGRAFPRRKNLYADDDRVKNDVKYLSLYKKNREAADHPGDVEAQVLSGDWYRKWANYAPPKRERPISRFYRPTYVPDSNLPEPPPPAPVKKTSSTRSQSQPTVETPSSTVRAERQTSLKEETSEDFEDTATRMKNRKKKKQEEAKLAEEQAEEAARKAELARQEKLAQEAALERQKELEKKAELARQEELAKQAEAERLEAERKAEAERLEAELLEAERKAEEERLEAERKAEAARKAEAERKAEEERLAAEKKAEEERLEAERKAEEERQAELERQEAERKAELERQEAERKAEEERQAELERQEAERKAEEERQAELKRQEEELALQEEEAAKLAAENAATESNPPEETTVSETTEEKSPEEVPAAGEEAATVVESAASAEADIQSPEAGESGPEPVVEEPQSPEAQEITSSQGAIEEVHELDLKEEDEEEEE
ncbi:hypothetical protein L9F63_006612, partial [Diploptera punctata]